MLVGDLCIPTNRGGTLQTEAEPAPLTVPPEQKSRLTLGLCKNPAASPLALPNFLQALRPARHRGWLNRKRHAAEK